MEVIEFKNVVWDMTRRISECMDGMFRPISEQYGLTHMQMRILMELWSAEDSPTIGQLGRTLGMTSGNMSSMCKRLEQEGFLLRVRDLQDERMVKIALSEKGKDTVRAIDRLVEEKYASCLERLGRERMEQVAENLREIDALLRDMLENHQKGTVE